MNKLIPLDIYTKFMNLNGTLQIIKMFTDSWIRGKIYEYDFERSPFTMLDHRRLSELLIHFYPHKYTLGTIDAFHVD